MLALERYNILGLNVAPLGTNEILDYIHESIEGNKNIVISSGNVYSLNLSYENKWLRDFLNKTEIVRIDGQGLIVAAKFLHKVRFPKRSTWADFGWELFEFTEQNRYSMFFLGAKEGIADLASRKVKNKYPDINIKGTFNGYFDKNSSSESKIVIDKINSMNIDILIIGFGMPIQEKWLVKYRHLINVPVVMTGGAVFDYISETLSRGPKFLTNNGFEWLARFIIDPKRLWKRYLFGNLLFIIRLIFQKFNIIKR